LHFAFLLVDDLARAQQKAAELILEDEAWRDGLEDQTASDLLNQALAQTDAALTQAAQDGVLDEDLPYALAKQARATLMERAMAVRDAPPDSTPDSSDSQDMQPVSGPPPLSDADEAPPLVSVAPDETLSDEAEVSPFDGDEPPR
jgi:hypothetical protein